MILQNNYFNLIGVRPSDSVEVITDAAEYKAFTDQQNEFKYENARTVLISPNRRVDAEVGYIFSEHEEDSDRRVEGLLSLDSEELEMLFTYRERLIINLDQFAIFLDTVVLDNADFIEAVVEHFIGFDKLYTRVFSDNCIKREIGIANKYRETAAISKISNIDTYKDALHRLLDPELQGMIQRIFSVLPINDSVKLANQLTETKITPSIGDNKKKYGVVVEKVVEAYSMLVQSVLEDEEDVIDKMIDKAYGYEDRRQLQPLFNKIRKFDFIAQPLQLYFQDLGKSDKQFESVYVANSLRKLALYYHIEKEYTDFSLEIINLEIELFSELPEIYAKICNDKKTLERILPKRYVQIETRKLFYKIDKEIKRDDEHLDENAEFVTCNKEQWFNCLDKLSLKAVADSDYKALASCVRSIAIAVTWADEWCLSYKFMEFGLKWAEKANDEELLEEYRSKMEEWEES